MEPLAGGSDILGQQALFNTLRDGVIVVDKNHLIQFINVSARHLLGLDGQMPKNATFEDLVQLQLDGQKATQDNSPIKKAFDKEGVYASLSESGKSYTMARSSDRSLMNVDITVVPVRSPDASVDSCIVVFHDSATDEKVDRAKSEFIALVSHQLRTPVNIISWYVEKLLNERHGELNPSQKSYLDEIGKSNKRVIELVQAIVNVSRTDLNRIKHKHEKIDVIQVVRKVIRELEELAKAKNIKLEASLPEDSISFNDSDQELLSVPLKNILHNALRYTQDGGTVSLELRRISQSEPLPGSDDTAPDDGCVIAIQDNGIGIPDEEKQKVFSKLFRATNVQVLDVTGVGLGLYIAQSFIQELNGQLWFRSEIRSGSTFYLYVPAT